VEEIASSLVLPQVDRGLRKSGVLPPHNASEAHAFSRLEREAARKALDKLRHNDSACILAADLVSTDLVNLTAEAVLRQGLPPFSTFARAPSDGGEVRIAYLVQVSKKDQLHLVKRTFDRLYSPRDTFLYSTDAKSLSGKDVREALAGKNKTLPANVQVRESRHAGFFFYPRVAVLLSGVEAIVNQSKDWDVLVHLSESGYPVHHREWIRRALGMYRHTSFIESVPYRLQGPAAATTGEGAAQRHEPTADPASQKEAAKPALRGAKVGDHTVHHGESPGSQPTNGAHSKAAHSKAAHSNWWFWDKKEPVASCGLAAVPVPKGKAFPLDAMADRGFDFRHGEEWNILTRELCEYVAQPGLADFKMLMSFRWGADEMFWPTLIANIPNFTQKVDPASMWYKRWQGHGSTPHSPDLIQWPHHTPELFDSRPHHFFVRKLRLPESQTTVDWLDKDADEEAKHMPANGTVAFYPFNLPRSNMANTH
jgi:hypothetical protein